MSEEIDQQDMDKFWEVVLEALKRHAEKKK